MKVLLAIDGSKSALNAVKYARKLFAQLVPAKHSITLINVHDDVSLRHAKIYVGSDVVADYLRELSEKDLKPAQKLLDATGIRHDMVVRTGHVAQEIVACAKAGKYDMVVMGSKGRTAISDLLLGSVAQRVLTTSDVPVLLIK